MNAKLIFDDSDHKEAKTIEGISVVFREGDILSIDDKFYKVMHAIFDLSKKEATYWVDEGDDAHPVAPEKETRSKKQDAEPDWK